MSGVRILSRVCLVIISTLIMALMLGFLPNIPFITRNQIILLTVLYLIVLSIFGSVFGSFEIGYHRIRELSVWFSLALFLTNFLAWIDLTILARRPEVVLQMLYIWVVQSLAGMVLIYIFTKRFYKVFQIRRICAVVAGNRYEERALAKLATVKERYHIERIINESSLDTNRLEEAFHGCNTVLAGDVEPDIRHRIIKFCFEEGRMVLVLPEPINIVFRGAKPIQVYDTLVYMHEGVGLTPEQRFFKRCLDIVGSLIGVIISIIPIGICAIIIKLYDGGTVFYKQDRYTIDGRVFKLLKLRSMRMDAEKNGVQFSTVNDNRVTPIGKFIRRTRLDETPQFFNVLKGDMSLVGPRAERPEVADAFTKRNPAFAYRLKVKAGITGYSQINGQYNTDLEDKLRMDIYYIEHYAFFRDVSMLFETIKLLFSPNSTAGYDEQIVIALAENGVFKK